MGTKNNPGSFDCYAAADPDEPIFILLGRDKNAPDLIRRWAHERSRAGENPLKVQEALNCAAAMDSYRRDLELTKQMQLTLEGKNGR